ncbi:lysophospholipid acyltransferase family protein [Cognatazoarcus halotolerans]|uniref:lysophospholipid acyltransferase family protein n=1 Tax=Cognatazoarcus halotolerans TaxID=2686016 RepID=UPI00135A9384|nr:lysophospholipid acyltransferase family protein [Cognatazoarcus halotolerans]MBX3680197.1 lysophospholipid acyltransferase family protein [Rhodocyclaceae bacterium]MCB1901230.1 lysophospholipid acyltransferase family protein [Rhodocyclaceae bacterium]MCP5307917.1 lysophospholipid acyltransferase family protein [Zoogloeaceae bacterium]
MLLARLFHFLSHRSLATLHRLGAVAGWLTYCLSPKYRRRLKGNLAQAFGGSVPEGVVPAAVRGAGEQAMELPWVWLRSPSEVIDTVKVSGWELVEEARANRRGILFLTPHLGCFEISAQFYGSRYPITVLYRPPKRAELQPLIEAGRGSRPGMRLAPADLAGVRRLIKALRAGEAVGMLPDQVPGNGEGVWAPFFGRTAYSMTLAARLSEVSGTVVIMAWAERLPRGAGYHLWLSAPESPLEGDTETRVAAINREMERLIRRKPEQYLWGYNRYKAPKGAARPESQS